MLRRMKNSEAGSKDEIRTKKEGARLVGAFICCDVVGGLCDIKVRQVLRFGVI